MLCKKLDWTFYLPDNRLFRFLQTKSEIVLSLISVLTFLGTLNIAGTQKYFILIAAALMVVYILYNRAIRINFRFVLAAAFGVFYTLGATFYNGFQLNYLFYPLSVIVLFQFCLSVLRAGQTKHLHRLIFAYACGFFASYALLVFASISNQGLFYDGGFITDYWNQDPYASIARTGLSLYCVGFFAFVFANLYKNQFRSKLTVGISITTILFCFLTSVLSGNRSLAIVFFLFGTVIAILWLRRIRNAAAKVAIFGTLVALACLLILLFFGIIPLPFKITFLERLLDPAKNSNSERIQLYVLFFQNFYRYPFGGLNTIENFNYVHNVILDMYTFGGFVPFAVFSVFCIDFVRVLVLARRHTGISSARFALFATLFAISIGLGLFEPIYNANPNILSPLIIAYLCLISGAYGKGKKPRIIKLKVYRATI